ncbi:hypothetical protein [Pseudomonas sp. IT-194MI4]|uniref:hypothetical protein n=1 Tax=Pseudomonas sp. IT-194MI4 TaxID=3026443 RepID=UPI0039E00B22
MTLLVMVMLLQTEESDWRKNKMLTDVQARLSLKELMHKYLNGKDPEYQHLIDIVNNPSRQVPIRGVLEQIRKFNQVQLTQQEMDLIDELLYMHG